ncbi:MAG: TetR/AcrR family transcriptional regulator [Pseudomonadota bacterium]
MEFSSLLARTDLGDRQKTVLGAAFTTFGHYSYARTTMDDLAEASGISRTALYKIYRNKEHIFRAVCECIHSVALEDASRALSGTSPFAETLADAVIARYRVLLNVGNAAAHADEMAELYLSLAGDLATKFEADFRVMILAAINEAIASNRLTLPPSIPSAETFADLVGMSVNGIKKYAGSITAFEDLARHLVLGLARP